MADETRTTALKCLELLFSRFRQGVNFQALITKPLMEKLEADELEAIFSLSGSQDLRAEKASTTEVFSSYRGPAMLKLASGHWILLVNSGQYQKQDPHTQQSRQPDRSHLFLQILPSILPRYFFAHFPSL